MLIWMEISTPVSWGSAQFYGAQFKAHGYIQSSDIWRPLRIMYVHMLGQRVAWLRHILWKKHLILFRVYGTLWRYIPKSVGCKQRVGNAQWNGRRQGNKAAHVSHCTWLDLHLRSHKCWHTTTLQKVRSYAVIRALEFITSTLTSVNITLGHREHQIT